MPAHPRARPWSKGREIGIGLVIAIFLTIQLIPLDNAKNLSPEEMAGNSPCRCLLCLLWMPLARALLIILSGKKDCTIYLAGNFGRGVFLAGSHHPGTGGDNQISRLKLAKAALCMAEKIEEKIKSKSN